MFTSMPKLKRIAILTFVSIAFSTTSFAQEGDYNYDEAKVPQYTLPELLITKSGKTVSTSSEWRKTRRSEILELFRTHVYGKSPEKPKQIRFKVMSEEHGALNGLAIRKEVRVFFGEGEEPHMDILMFLPANKKKVPVFLGLNFYGNHTIHPDPAITLSDKWMRNNKELGITENKALESNRGTAATRWPVEMILSSGYGLATIYYGDIDPDYDDGFQNGIHPLFYRDGQTSPAPDEWGSIAAWAWGLSRALDYLEKDKQVDARRVAVLGHSRLGKAALWAGAEDERFALVISNNSGCGGAALSRRVFGETLTYINTSFPHWFCDNFLQYNDREADLPVDQHMLIALMAPRPVYVASAAEDLWADPKGEFLSAKHASVVYELFGKKGLPAREMPGLHTPAMGSLGYHIRAGEHDVTSYDWEQFIRFANMHLKR